MKKYLIVSLAVCALIFASGAGSASADDVPPIALPTVTSFDFNNAMLADLGGDTSATVGYDLGRDPAMYGIHIPSLATLTAPGGFGFGFTGILCGTFHSRPFATNSAGMGFGSDLSMTFDPCPAIPISTYGAGARGMTSEMMQAYADATFFNGGPATVGFDYGTTTDYGQTVTNDPIAFTGITSATADDLLCDQEYHFRAFDINVSGVRAEGEDMTFTTLPCHPVVTNGVGSPSFTTAILTGTLKASMMAADGTNVGFTVGNDNFVAGTNVMLGDFSYELTGLACGTPYTFNAYATDGELTYTGETLSFSTLPCGPWTVTTNPPVMAGATGAILSGTVTAGSSPTTEVGFEFGTTTEYGRVSAEPLFLSLGDHTFEFGTTGILECGITYHYRAFATDGTTTIRGEDMTFVTYECIRSVDPSVATTTASGITATGATLVGDLASMGDISPVDVGFQYRSGAEYGSEIPPTLSLAESGSFENTVGVLSCGTTYHYRAFALSSSGAMTIFGEEKTFATLPCETTGGGGGGGAHYISGYCILGKVDANGDCRADILDFVALMAHWKETGANNSADFNSDSNVEMPDFVLLMANWTK